MKNKGIPVKFTLNGDISNVMIGYKCECRDCTPDNFFIKDEEGCEYHGDSINKWYQLRPKKSHLPNWW